MTLHLPLLDATAGFETLMIVLSDPASPVPLHALPRLRGRGGGHRGEQDPLQGLHDLGRLRLRPLHPRGRGANSPHTPVPTPAIRAHAARAASWFRPPVPVDARRLLDEPARAPRGFVARPPTRFAPKSPDGCHCRWVPSPWCSDG